MQAVASTVKTPWKELNFEISTALDGTAFGVKFLVIPVSGTLINVAPNNPILDLVCEIWRMRDAFDSPGWRGMKLSITSGGSCNVDFKCDTDTN
jgi:hypothetical protein